VDGGGGAGVGSGQPLPGAVVRRLPRVGAPAGRLLAHARAARRRLALSLPRAGAVSTVSPSPCLSLCRPRVSLSLSPTRRWSLHRVSLTVSLTVSPPCLALSLPRAGAVSTVSPSPCLSLCLPHRLSHGVAHRVSLTVSLTVSPPCLALSLSHAQVQSPPCLPHRVSHCVSLTVSLTVSPTLCYCPCLPHRLSNCVAPVSPSHRLSRRRGCWRRRAAA
jgi:hypothetical protein